MCTVTDLGSCQLLTSAFYLTLAQIWQVTFHPIILLTSAAVRQGQPITVTAVHLRGSTVNLWFFSLWQWHLSVWSPGPVQSDWAVYGYAVLWCLWTHRGLGFEWCVRERNRNSERQREVLTDSKCTFLLQCHQEKRTRAQTTTEVTEKDNMALPCLHVDIFIFDSLRHWNCAISRSALAQSRSDCLYLHFIFTSDTLI